METNPEIQRQPLVLKQSRKGKKKKEKKAYITWEYNDMDSSSDLENKIINLSLMAKDYESGEELAH